MQDLVIDGKTMGYYKTVKQVGYCELIDAGHHLFHDSSYLTIFFKGWIDTLKTEEQEAVPRHISTE